MPRSVGRTDAYTARPGGPRPGVRHYQMGPANFQPCVAMKPDVWLPRLSDTAPCLAVWRRCITDCGS
jgi:hypothetical protein